MDMLGLLFIFTHDIGIPVVPANQLAGIIMARSLRLAGGFIDTLNTQNQRGIHLFQGFGRLAKQGTLLINDMNQGPAQYKHRMLFTLQSQIMNFSKRP